MLKQPTQEQQYTFMLQALELAKLGQYTARPNPAVGCVLVKDNQVIGQGAHLKAGQPHAEVNALTQAGKQAFGADAYVTLEPCSHTGRTGPCADALIAAGIKRVFIAQLDPNPLVSGRGVAKLKAAGIEVITGILTTEAQTLNAAFNKRMLTNKPKVIIKLAASLDGATAMTSGESHWITGSEARAAVQHLRARSCAIISGVDSVAIDNSRLTVRSEEIVNLSGFQQPIRIVVDSQLRLPTNAAILQQAGQTYIATSAQALQAKPSVAADLQQAGAKFITVPLKGRHLDLKFLIAQLTELDVNQVLVETGARLAGAFLQEKLVDELEVYLAPILLGTNTQGLVELTGVTKLAQGVQLKFISAQAVGQDWHFVLQPLN